jgi:hypothetical protein
MMGSKSSRAARMAASYPKVLQRAGVNIGKHQQHAVELPTTSKGEIKWWSICISQISKPSNK